MCELILEQIKTAVEIIDCNVPLVYENNYIDTLCNHTLDCNDYILIELCKKNKINKILTDDADFKCFINEFDIYSANKNMLNNDNCS